MAPVQQKTFNLVCSTPYGIRGLGTFTGSPDAVKIKKCSTPYGIRGLGTILATRSINSAHGAQRLTASEVWAPHLTQNQFLLAKVLNALRHQRFGHKQMYEPVNSMDECSTPYGIRGLGT